VDGEAVDVAVGKKRHHRAAKITGIRPPINGLSAFG
jgi:hypothetical protein